LHPSFQILELISLQERVDLLGDLEVISDKLCPMQSPTRMVSGTSEVAEPPSQHYQSSTEPNR